MTGLVLLFVGVAAAAPDADVPEASEAPAAEVGGVPGKAFAVGGAVSGGLTFVNVASDDVMVNVGVSPQASLRFRSASGFEISPFWAVWSSGSRPIGDEVPAEEETRTFRENRFARLGVELSPRFALRGRTELRGTVSLNGEGRRSGDRVDDEVQWISSRQSVGLDAGIRVQHFVQDWIAIAGSATLVEGRVGRRVDYDDPTKPEDGGPMSLETLVQAIPSGALSAHIYF